MQKGAKAGVHTEHLGYLLAEMQALPRSFPGAKVVTPQAQLVSITPAAQAPTPITPAQAPEAQLWAWLAEVPDPEIPVVSVVDLGIVRSVAWNTTEPASEFATVCVTVTPTYSGCPATEVIGTQIREALLARGVTRVELKMQLSPPWTTDWMTDRARQNLREYGIVPPTEREAAPVSASPPA